jgi:hypothetical protein
MGPSAKFLRHLTAKFSEICPYEVCLYCFEQAHIPTFRRRDQFRSWSLNGERFLQQAACGGVAVLACKTGCESGNLRGSRVKSSKSQETQTATKIIRSPALQSDQSRNQRRVNIWNRHPSVYHFTHR